MAEVDWSQFKPAEEEVDWSQFKPAPEKPSFGENVKDVGTSVVEGVGGTWRSLKAAGQGLIGDAAGAEQTARDAAAAARDSDAESLKAFKEDIARRKKSGDEGILQGVANVAGAAWDNPAGAVQMAAEQLPNAAAAMAPAFAGFKAGAAVAPFAGPLAPLMPIAGGVLGYFLGNTALETGGKVIEKAEGGLTDEERVSALKEGAVKGAIITGVDAATFGATKLLYSTVGRAMERAGVDVLVRLGVDVADKASVAKAVAVPAVRKEIEAAQAAAAKSAGGGATGAVGRATGAVGLQTVGEGLGEGLGEYGATGTYSPTEAALEALSSAGQSVAETAIAREKPDARDLVGRDLPDPIGDLEKEVDTFVRSAPTAAEVAAPIMAAETVEGAIAAADATSGSITEIARRQGAALAPAMDRQAALAAEAARAGFTKDAEGAQAQAAVALEAIRSPAEGRAADYVDLAPMDARTAQGRLRVLRDMEANEGRDALSLVIEPHPGSPGKFAIARRQAALPSLDLPAPAAPSAASGQASLEAAALAGKERSRRAEDAPRQVVITNALKAIEQRGGVASPAEAQIVAEAGLGRPYDRIDESLAPPLSMDEKLTQATGIALDKAPRESAIQSKAAPAEAQLVAQEQKDRSDSRMAAIVAEKAAAAAAPAAAPASAPVNVDAMLSILKKDGALHNAQEKALVNEARRGLSAEQFDILQRAAVNPPSLSATDRLTLRQMREGDITLTPSEQRKGASAAVRELRKYIEQSSSARADKDDKTAPDWGWVHARAKKLGLKNLAEYTRPDPNALRPGPDTALEVLDDDITLTPSEQRKGWRKGFSSPAPKGAQEQVVERKTPSSDPQPAKQRTDAPQDSLNSKEAPAAEEAQAQGRKLQYKHSESRLEEGAGQMNRNEYRLVRAIGRIFGKKVQVFSSERADAPDGYVLDNDRGTIYLNAKSQIGHLVVFGHELMHQLKRDNPAGYEAVLKVIRLKEGANIDVAGIRGDMEELTSDLLGNRFKDPDFWVEVFNQLRRPEALALGQQLRKTVQSFIRAMRGVVGFDTDNLVANLEEVKSALSKALADYARSSRSVTPGARSTPPGAQNDRAVTSEKRDGRQPAAAPGGQQSGVVSEERAAPSYGTAREGAAPAVAAWHFSQAARPVLSSGAFGTGLKGSSREQFLNATDERSRQRIYFYIDKGNGIHPESGVGGYAHEVTLANLYDGDRDPLALKRGTDWQAFESGVMDAGFDGYLWREHNLSAAAVLLGKRSVPVAYRGQGKAATRPGAGLPVEDSQAVWQVQATGPAEMMQRKADALRAKPAWREYIVRVVEDGSRSRVEVVKRGPVLNIGMSTREVKGGGELTTDAVKAALADLGVQVQELVEHTSDTELTAVVSISRQLTPAEGDSLSVALSQEAIVQRLPDGSGDLYGPQAENWGPYNPEYFVMPDGSRASGGPAALQASEKRDVTKTEAFKKWFGDSVVTVDGKPGGKPMVVYHGGQKLTAWNRKGDDSQVYGGHADAVKSEYGSMLSRSEREALDSPVHFFTDDESVAEGYADQGSNYEVRREYVKMERPLDLRVDVAGEDAVEAAMRKLLGDDYELDVDHRGISQALRWNWSDIGKKVRALGYDGIILYDTDVRDHGKHTSYAVFEPTQIKSATGNSGAFDPADPDITKSEKRKRVHDLEISTRQPSAKKGVTEDAAKDLLISDFAAGRAHPGWLNAVSDLISQYPNYRDVKSASTPEQITERLVRHMTDNLLWLHDQVPAEVRARSKHWYDGARAIAERMAQKYGLTDAQAAGILAALSPQKDWFVNVSLAERVAQIMAERGSFRWSDKMEQTARRIFAGATYREPLDDIRGASLDDIDDNYLRAMWLRIHDEAHNSRSFTIVGPEGDALAVATTKGGTPAKAAWGSIPTIAKAVSIYNNGDVGNISEQLGRKHKVRNFYNNILVPDSPNGHVTIDTHAVAAALLRALSGNSIEVTHNFGGPSNAISGLQGTYALYEEAYRRAAEQRGLLPRELQSITWEAIRGLYRPSFKAREANTSAVDKVWTQYQKGRLSYEAARNQIVELAGGIDQPSWFGRDPGVYEEEGAPADEGDLDGAELPRRGAAAVDRGTRSRAARAVPKLVASEKRAPFYSALQRAVEGIATKAAPAAGWRDAIKGLVAKGAVKADEVEWSGVNEWLALQQGKVTRDQVLQYLGENGVVVEETQLGGGSATELPMDWVTEEDGEDYVVLDEDGEPRGRGATPAEAEQDALDNLGSARPGTKYGKFTLPGGTNYREVLLTLPPAGTDAAAELARAEKRLEALTDIAIEFGEAGNDGDKEKFQAKAAALQNRIDELRKKVAPAKVAGNYKSSHWDQPNILAHIRVNDRTDTGGKKVLFVEEIQSDWGQAGKKDGFKKNISPVTHEIIPVKTSSRSARPDGYGIVRKDDEDQLTSDIYRTREEAESALRGGGAEGARVPRAPFVTKTDAWVALALKRVIKMAVDEGYDAVAFVNGEQSADRYDLSKQVRKITGTVLPDGRLQVDTEAINGDGPSFIADSEQDLADKIGKEPAERLMKKFEEDSGEDGSGRQASISGLDLKVGGEGMMAFYDKIVPSVAKDVLKKLGGAALREVSIPRDGVGNVWLNGRMVATGVSRDIYEAEWGDGYEFKLKRGPKGEPDTLVQPGFDVTPAMREKAAGGVPLFSEKRDVTSTPEFKRWFGGSKVTDKDGRPLVVYHGSGANIVEFDARETLGGFIWFARSARYAGGYAEERGEIGAPTVYPAYLKIENPVDLSSFNLNSTAWDHGAIAGATGLDEGRLGDIAMTLYDDFDAKPKLWELVNTPSFASLARRAGFDGVVAKEGRAGRVWGAIGGEQIKSAIGNRGTFDATDPDITKSEKRIFDASGRQYTDEQLKAFEQVGFAAEVPTLRERLQALKKDLGKRVLQGVFDQFAPIKDLDKRAYALARLSRGASGAFEALLKHGKLRVDETGVYDADQSGGAIERVFMPLRNEVGDFLRWIAANRAERLLGEGRERLFDPKAIAAIKSLSEGELDFDYTLADGTTTRNRAAAFQDSVVKFNEFNRNVLDVAEQSGLIDPEAREHWESGFYVPFYRVSGDEEFNGASIKNGLIRQEAFKALKGGTDKLNKDLLHNTLMNWAHLVDAAAKNRAAIATLESAEEMGIAVEAPAETAKEMAKAAGAHSVWVMDEGVKRHFVVDDPLILTAISSLQFAGFRGFAMDALSKPKHWLTVGVTVSPFFKVRNLIRDSISAIAVSDLSGNVAGNLARGVKASNPASQTYVSALAGGGLIRFGTMLEGSESARVRKLVEMGHDKTTILDSDNKIRHLGNLLEKAFSAYQELGNRGEEINRSALYEQLIQRGAPKDEAALAARDLLDFSMAGSWHAVRFLAQVVPFLNARLQGLLKLGKGAKENPARFTAVVGAVLMASLALMAAYSDDEDWKKREDWDRNNFWWFKVGGVAYRIPKPFEVGALATLAERGIEMFFNDEMTGNRYWQVVKDLFSNSLSMNPVPQTVKPMIDLYANRDSFTGRPIESMGMERVDPQDRFTSSTTLPARAVSSATGGALSPVQVDHLVRAYFGWAGALTIGTLDAVWRPVSSEPTRPQRDYWKWATGGIVAETEGAPSHYTSNLYDQAKEVEQAYNTWRQRLQSGRVEDAQEYFDDNKDEILKHKSMQKIRAGASRYNEMIRAVERSPNLTAEQKKARINQLRGQQDRLARAAGP